ncbi:hypothetical protein A2767_03965 [Candidatus Roizmanbacteria bacterium RIFCSPHIGHO2_01_FULL_35_10]|uniref:Uncharacterized protein n=1 Tax=Candidatus Roizmanbacteria bacterium RIFCSPLOWO2_01_FULL_35_13 TaxID=1802055 RepID=A0A1F7IA06_9BACT|nr:MAG: hypothetical protein A2767_03965 [Candidatus Roizmanbacteria bacterium RIFCSPHIGHO2_01_FULL_35_10]OGK40179.1 MAG: hypothetical protein A3A74_06715 [Candidatus Roizmanbacteria bacterium RIFCSPLOWO2_01_FULL_35_13]
MPNEKVNKYAVKTPENIKSNLKYEIGAYIFRRKGKKCDKKTIDVPFNRFEGIEASSSIALDEARRVYPMTTGYFDHFANYEPISKLGISY